MVAAVRSLEALIACLRWLRILRSILSIASRGHISAALVFWLTELILFATTIGFVVAVVVVLSPVGICHSLMRFMAQV
jgi:hypothetical protein